MTSMPPETDTEYIEEREELGLGAPIRHDKLVQEICTPVDDHTAIVEYYENEGELIGAYVSTILQLKLKHGPK